MERSAASPEETPVTRDLQEELARLRAEVRRLSSALEDILALAHSSGESRQRAVQMERRAIAALSGADQKRPPAKVPRRAGDEPHPP